VWWGEAMACDVTVVWRGLMLSYRNDAAIWQKSVLLFVVAVLRSFPILANV
jgi:hypothetical protein